MYKVTKFLLFFYYFFFPGMSEDRKTEIQMKFKNFPISLCLH